MAVGEVNALRAVAPGKQKWREPDSHRHFEIHSMRILRTASDGQADTDNSAWLPCKSNSVGFRMQPDS